MSNRLTHRVRAVREAGDAGVTLVELIVTMALSSIIGGLTLSLFVNTSTAVQDTTDRTIGSSQARTVLQSWTSYLRVADGPIAGQAAHRIEWLTPTDLLFHADVGNRSGNAGTAPGTPDLVRLRLFGTQLVEQRLHAGTTTCRVLADHVTAPALFTGYTTTGTATTGLDLGVAATTTSACAALPASPTQLDATAVANLQNVASVTIDFSVTDGRNVHTREYSSIGYLPAVSAAA